MQFTLAPRGSEILGLIDALLQQPSFAVRTENGSKSRHIYSDTYRVKMCKMASTTEAIIKMENTHKIHDLAWLHLKPSHMCVTGWPYSFARLLRPLKQASPSRRENSSFVIIDVRFCDKKTRLSWIKG